MKSIPSIFILAIAAALALPAVALDIGKATVNSGQSTELTIPGLIRLQLPKGSLPNGQVIQISKTQSTETAKDFEISASVYPKNVRRLPYEFRLNTGNTRPSSAIEVNADVPREFVKQFQEGATFGAFVQFFYDGENESYDHFESVISKWDDRSGKVLFVLDPSAFTNRRGSRGSYEAIFVVAGQDTESSKKK